MKKCNRCKKEKDIECFHMKRVARDGRASLCKECVSLQKKKHYSNNRDFVKEYKKKYYQDNKERIKRQRKEYYQQNKECILERNREYYFLNKDKIIAQTNLYEKNRRKKDINFRIKKRVSCSVHYALKTQDRNKDGGRTFDHLPYTPQQLKEHIENQFEDWMTWDNWGEWHIDHIIPQSALLYDSLEHPNFQKCWSLNNLRPLRAEDNLKKSNKLI